MRPTFPGGLRIQLLLGLTILLIVSAALGAVVVENVMTRRLLASRQHHVKAVATVVQDLPIETRQLLVTRGVVDAMLVRGGTAVGDPAVVEGLRAADGRFFTVHGRRFLRVRHGDLLLAARIDDLRADVSDARVTLLLFGLLVAIAVIALGYGFFGFVVVRPIRAIGVATDRAAQGDLASPITLVPRNEYGRVATSFNEMLRRLDVNREQLETRLAELQATNAELETTRDSLVRSEKLASVGQLAAGIAHEIGNPLAALSGYNELLKDGELEPEDVSDVLRRSGEQLERIRTVIRNLLDFSRDESDAEPAPTTLQQVVQETVSLVRVGPRSRDVEFVVGELDGPAVQAVASQIVQVLVNLALNASDALADRGGTVTFARSDANGFAELTVADDGPGVPPELANRIFDPFFTTKEPGDGTGLGLAISARIIESFGGSLTVGEAASGGAVFTVRLPHSEGG